MVGYDPDEKQLSNSDQAMAGIVSGALTRIVIQPLDVIKIRFQLQVEPLKKGTDSKYWGIIHATKTISKEEGLRALWKGLVTAQIVSILYGSIQFVSFEFLTKKYSLYTHSDTKATPLINFCAGSISGCLASFVASPFDVVKTRIIGISKPHRNKNKSLFYNYTSIYKREGFFAFYKGLSASLLQVAPLTGLQFMFYNLFNNIWLNVYPQEEHKITFLGSIMTGSLSGLSAKTIVYPLDLMRKRMQIQGIEKRRQNLGKVFKCTNLLQCFILIVREEKFSALFKGLSPSLLKASAMTALQFAIYDGYCNVLRIIR